MFLWSRSTELNNHQIHLDLHMFSDYAPLLVVIAIEDKYINKVKYSIAKNGKEEANFVKKVLIAIKNIDISDLSNISKLEEVINSLVPSINFVWNKNSKCVKITKTFQKLVKWRMQSYIEQLQDNKKSGRLENIQE